MNKHIITCLFVVCALFYVQAQEIEPELPDSTEQVVYDPLPTLEPFTQAELDSIMVEARNVKFVQENFSETPVLTSVGPTINENNLVGEIPIQYSHDKNGGVNYTVPLEVHPGRSGMQPGLSLAYNSMRGNSILGYGWGLAGLSAITPTNNTIYYNGKTSPVTLTQDDAFVLDGMQLIRTGTLSYETVQGNIKVQGYGSNNIVKYFRATTSDGKRMTYGYTSNTTAECQYPLTEIKDINGNYITYTYDQIGNIYYVSQISYGGNTSTSNTSGHFAFIRFNYKQRPDNYAIYIGGKKIEETRLIESISTYYGETLLRTYSPVYGTTDVSMLQQIKCEAGGKQLNPLSFDYWKDEQVGKYIENGPIIIRQPTPSKPSLFYCRAKFDATSPNDGLIGYYNIGTYGRTSENRNINGYYGSTYPADYPIFIYPELSDSVVSPVKFNAGDGFQLFSPADIDGDNNQELVKVNYILNRYNDDENAKIQVSTYRKDGSIIGSKTFVVKGAFSVFGNIGSISLIERKFFIGDFDGDGKEELLSVSVSDSPTAFGKRSYSIVELIRLDNLTMICSNQQLNTNSIRNKN